MNSKEKATGKKAKDFNTEPSFDGTAKHEKKFELEKEGEDWQAQELEVQADKPLLDEGKGDKYAIRSFSFKFSPDILSGRKKIPTKQELFNAHLKQIEMEVWKDRMGIDKNHTPQFKWVIDPITQKATGYAIGVVCGIGDRAHTRGITDDTMTLQEILSDRSS